MTERQSQLLKQLIESHIATAEPVASSLLAEKQKVSSATVRNEMASLEKEGYIRQPHTSAGRIPTLKGYQHYLQHFLAPKTPSQGQQESLVRAAEGGDHVRSVAKELAEHADIAVLVAFANNDFYYTGLSKLFAQPEFIHSETIIDISLVLDALDDTLEQLYGSAGEEVNILIGNENPFSPQCSLLITKSPVRESEGVMALLGPVRMNYNRNAGLLSFTKMLLTKKHA